MSMLALAVLVAAPQPESCAVVRQEQGAFNAQIFARLERINRALRRADGSIRQPTPAERKEFAAIEAQVESFIDRFNTRLANCQES